MMNKDEAVQKIATAGRLSIAHAEDLYDSFFPKPIVPPYSTQALTTLVNMHRFGYEVEKETRYTVRIKGIGGYSKYLNRDTKTQKWLFASKTELERFRAHHTRKELEDADFGWVFSCEGVEVKEVE